MGIFYKRPLCLFCFCFIGSSLFATMLGVWGKLILFTVGIGAVALLFFLSGKIKKRKYGLIEAAICTVFASVALVLSLFAIDLPLKNLEKFSATNAPIEFVVCKKEYSSKYSTKYEGILLSTDKGDVNEKAYLYFEHEADYKAGDKLLLMGNVEVLINTSKESFLPSDVNLEIISTLDKDLVICDSFDGFSLSVSTSKLREYIRDVLFGSLEPESASLSLGIITSDTSMISGEIIRDFRRAGVSHLLAVSGLHLSIIVGLFEFILRKLRISKALRCVAITAVAFLLLCISGFSPSACRSVLMLLVVYLCYILSREPDTLTSLSVAGALILFFSPLSVGSISFWLSFLATLGIILYSELLSKLHRRRREAKNPISRAFLNIARKITSALVVTLSANIFICIIFWIFFGETSLVSPIANLTVTPLGEIYLILSILTLFLGRLSFVGTLLCKATSLLASIITSLAKFFSANSLSVVSLKYAFAGIIIIAMTISLAILFIVKLKNKRWLFAPPALALVSFCICLVIYNTANSELKLAYVSDSGRDSIVVLDGNDSLIIDVSDGSYSSLYSSYEWVKQKAVVDVDKIILTHYHPKHISSLDKLFRATIVDKIYLPAPESTEEINILRDIISSAEENGVAPEIYEKEKLCNIDDTYTIYLTPASNSSISFALATKDGILYYTDSEEELASNTSPKEVFVNSCDTMIFGAHPTFKKPEELSFNKAKGKIIFADEKIFIREFFFENNP